MGKVWEKGEGGHHLDHLWLCGSQSFLHRSSMHLAPITHTHTHTHTQRIGERETEGARMNRNATLSTNTTTHACVCVPLPLLNNTHTHDTSMMRNRASEREIERAS